MLTVFYQSLDQKGQSQRRYFIASCLEAGLDRLTLLVASRWILEQVEVFDGPRDHLSLPPELFDGQPFTALMKALESEWKVLLALS